ncbi:hypothetical protein NDU88_001259 [Pleurodeles waltl]|uniref:Uncharacterized protein n=1 Tax=Pleurodeles waltl TaxID=8319 RepID=A0AAV7Q388_PLEWA|nr:hypothetical protein NDU88_001259 [Pleurodeles waltl]
MFPPPRRQPWAKAIQVLPESSTQQAQCFFTQWALDKALDHAPISQLSTWGAPAFPLWVAPQSIQPLSGRSSQPPLDWYSAAARTPSFHHLSGLALRPAWAVRRHASHLERSAGCSEPHSRVSPSNRAAHIKGLAL